MIFTTSRNAQIWTNHALGVIILADGASLWSFLIGNNWTSIASQIMGHPIIDSILVLRTISQRWIYWTCQPRVRKLPDEGCILFQRAFYIVLDVFDRCDWKLVQMFPELTFFVIGVNVTVKKIPNLATPDVVCIRCSLAAHISEKCGTRKKIKSPSFFAKNEMLTVCMYLDETTMGLLSNVEAAFASSEINVVAYVPESFDDDVLPEYVTVTYIGGFANPKQAVLLHIENTTTEQNLFILDVREWLQRPEDRNLSAYVELHNVVPNLDIETIFDECFETNPDSGVAKFLERVQVSVQ